MKVFVLCVNKMDSRKYIVYVDGIYDLFHRGHVESLQKAKTIRKNVYLIVGLISSTEATKYKRKPIFEDDDRYLILKSCRYVDQVIYNAPLVITPQFLEKNKVDIVVHGFSDMTDLKKQQPFIENIIDKFEYLPYFPYNSTSKYLKQINPGEVEVEMDDQINHFHGGQDVHELKDRLRVDMSVTTNGLGPNPRWSLTADQIRNMIDHYPPSKSTELLEGYYKYVGHRDNILFGNGASEVIDLLLRNLPRGNWKTNNVGFQYKEYENSCKLMGRHKVSYTNMDVNLTVIINPNNPTGNYSRWSELVGFIDRYVPNNSYLVVDESMIFWDPDWKLHSFQHHESFCKELLTQRNISVVVVQSWTKIFACTGLRFGSMYVCDNALYRKLSIKQTPWSVNVIARDYVRFCWEDDTYMSDTLRLTKVWRSTMIEKLRAIYPKWGFHGESFLSWIWVKTCSEEMADKIVKISKDNGFPIRHGKHSYNGPLFIRLGVRDPDTLKEWFEAIDYHPQQIISKSMLPRDLVQRVEVVPIENIKIHEEVLEENILKFQNFVNNSENFLIPSILVSPEYVIIDGHHRFSLFKRMGYKEVHVTVINYYDDRIVVHGDPIIASKMPSKKEIISEALQNRPMKPKSTHHMICLDGELIPLSILGTNLSTITT